MELRRFLIVVAAFLLIALTLTVWFFPSNDDFRVKNPFWNGISDAGDRYRIHPLGSLADLPPFPEGATVIAIPYLDYTPEELGQLNNFISRGGRLILADDYGYGNHVLDYLALEAHFNGQVLLDPVLNYKNKWFPMITRLQSNPLTDNMDTLVFNHATSLTGVAEEDVIALSSPFSFLDIDGNEQRDAFEPTGPLPVISRHELGDGQVILVSDPSLFINGMAEIEDNADFMQNIAVTAPALYIDQSHLTQSELHSVRNLLQEVRSLLMTPPGTMGLVVAALAVVLIPIWHKKKEITDDAYNQ